MIVLSYGYKKPSNPDTGDAFFPAMEWNVQLMNDHNHDGVNSAPLGSRTIDIPKENWVLDTDIGGGIYNQEVTLPAGVDYDVIQMWFKISTGQFVYPSVDRVSASKFKIYTNDNSLDYVAYFR